MNDPEAIKRLADNLAQIRDEMAEAAARSGRDASAVRLVAVTKYVDAAMAAALVEADATDLGESRPQELEAKATELAELDIRWHMVGHLQRNKVRRVLPLVGLIHSVDSAKLLEAIDRVAAEEELPPVRVLLEVNISGDADKHGTLPKELSPWLETTGELTHVRIAGLMGMASLHGGIDQARRDFAALRELRDTARAACPPPHSLDELSMGMSGDFEAAIEEGATIVRIGSRLFDGVVDR